MRTHRKTGPTFPADAMEARRFQSITGLSPEAFESLRPNLDVWTFGHRQYISESQALRAIGRLAVLKRRLRTASAAA
jgi:hypothetical protein